MTMEHELTAGVVIVGAGPVGLSLAMDRSQRGMSVIMAEVHRFNHPLASSVMHGDGPGTIGATA